MANKPISGAANRATLGSTDMIPIALLGQTGAYHVTGEALFGSIPAATSDSSGQVELATQAETEAASDDERAVTPASLANAIGPAHMAPGWCYAGQLTEAADVFVLVDAFEAAFGRSQVNGDMMVVKSSTSAMLILFWNSSLGGWEGMNVSTGSFVSYS